MSSHLLIEAKEKVGNGNIEAAFHLIKEVRDKIDTSNPKVDIWRENYNAFLLLKAQHERLKDNALTGTLRFEEVNRRQANIEKNVLKLIDKLIPTYPINNHSNNEKDRVEIKIKGVDFILQFTGDINELTIEELQTFILLLNNKVNKATGKKSNIKIEDINSGSIKLKLSLNRVELKALRKVMNSSDFPILGKNELIFSQLNIPRQVNETIKYNVYVEGVKLDNINQLKLTQSYFGHDNFEVLYSMDQKSSSSYHEKSTKLIGKKIEIYFQTIVQDISFVGIITSIGLTRYSHGENQEYIRGESLTYLLEDGLMDRSFTEMNLKSIIQQVLSIKSYPYLKAEVNPKFKNIIPYITQFQETTYQFISRLASLYGEIMFYNGEKLVFGNDSSPIKEYIQLNKESTFSHTKDANIENIIGANTNFGFNLLNRLRLTELEESEFIIVENNHIIYENGTYSNQFEAISETYFTLHLNTFDSPKISAPVSAIVVETNELGRVKIRLPWHEIGESSPWVSVIPNIEGGQKKGIFFVPEIDDEVLVSFYNSNPDKPYVMGHILKGEFESILEDPGEILEKGFKTKSGNIIFFDDDHEDESIKIIGKGRAITMTLSEDGNITIDAKNELMVTAKSISIQVNKEVSINGAIPISIKPNEKMVITSLINLSSDSSPVNLQVQGSTIKIN